MNIISIEDAKPVRQMRAFLVYCASNLCWFTAHIDDEDNEWYIFGTKKRLIEKVTHWTFLPDNPTGEE